MVSNHKAVDALCDILERSPSERKYDLITFACFGVGLSMDPTGLEPTKERKLSTLYWDLTLEDLKKRLVQLVDEFGLLEQVVVEGVLAFLISFYRTQADPNETPRVIQNHLGMIEHLKQELCLPASERKNKMGDKELNDFITKVEHMLEGCDERRQEAEKALHFLQQEAKDTFTDEFWKSIMLNQ